MDIECYIGCLTCEKAWFRLERHETKPNSHVFEHRIVSIKDDAVFATPGPCKTCGSELSRVPR